MFIWFVEVSEKYLSEEIERREKEVVEVEVKLKEVLEEISVLEKERNRVLEAINDDWYNDELRDEKRELERKISYLRGKEERIINEIKEKKVRVRDVEDRILFERGAINLREDLSADRRIYWAQELERREIIEKEEREKRIRYGLEERYGW